MVNRLVCNMMQMICKFKGTRSIASHLENSIHLSLKHFGAKNKKTGSTLICQSFRSISEESNQLIAVRVRRLIDPWLALFQLFVEKWHQLDRTERFHEPDEPQAAVPRSQRNRRLVTHFTQQTARSRMAVSVRLIKIYLRRHSFHSFVSDLSYNDLRLSNYSFVSYTNLRELWVCCHLPSTFSLCSISFHATHTQVTGTQRHRSDRRTNLLQSELLNLFVSYFHSILKLPWRHGSMTS